MDVVYPYRRRHDGFELRYSLRSLAAYVPHDRVIIAGDKPLVTSKAITLVQELPHLDRFKSSTRNIEAAIRKADVRGDFIVMNDDFFVLRRWQYRHEHRGTIEEYLASSGASGGYRCLVERTAEILKAHGVAEPLFFGLHKPTICDGARLLEVLVEFRREKFLLRTLYFNLFRAPAARREDVKLHTWPSHPPSGDAFSTSDTCAVDPACRAWLRSKFPQPSIYEKPCHSIAQREAA